MGEKRSIIFVCLGNTCRSPLAEVIFRSVFNSTGPHTMIDDPDTEAVVSCSSAGAFARSEQPYSSDSVRIAKSMYKEDISRGYTHIAIYERLIEHDIVICMTDQIADFLRNRFEELQDRIFSFSELIEKYGIEGVNGEVEDPYGYEFSIYMDTAKQIEDNIRALMPCLLKSWGMN